MSCEALNLSQLPKKYQEGPAASAPRGNFPETPKVIPANVNGNHIFEPLSCRTTTSDNPDDGFSALNPLP